MEGPAEGKLPYSGVQGRLWSLTSFLLVFITSNVPLSQIRVSAMNYTLLDAYSQRGLDLRSTVTRFHFISKRGAQYLPRLSGAFWAQDLLAGKASFPTVLGPKLCTL